MSDAERQIEQPRRMNALDRLKLRGLPVWMHGAALGGTLALTVILIAVFLLYRDVNVWDGWREAGEFRKPQYAETVYANSVFRTRMNTWSNLVFVLLGSYAIALSIHDARRRWPLSRGYLAHTPAQSALFGVAAIYLGLGSGFFHASLTRLGQQCDVGGMYAMMIAMVAICLGSWVPVLRKWKGENRSLPTWPILVSMGAIATVYFTVYKWSYSFSEVTRLLSCVIIAFAVASSIQRRKHLLLRWFVGGVVLIALAGYIRQLDIEGRFSRPDAICQGHAIWHVLSGAYFACMYLYFRSEERATQ